MFMSYERQQAGGTRHRSKQTLRLHRRRRRRATGLAVFLAGVTVIVLIVQSVVSGVRDRDGGNWTETMAQAAEIQSVEAGQGTDRQEWNLTLVNPWNKIPESYETDLTYLRNGQAVDSRCYPELQQMMDDCRAAGLSPVICASYRTMEKQEALFADKKERVIREGCPADEAEAEAAKTVALPGTSEHQLGLALDIVDLGYQELDTQQEDTSVQQWLMENSWKYGFVLRYPAEKSDITGIIYEPWHYRYVGKDVAAEMYENGLCLEEYLGVS